jgi:hypothetical protein
MTNLVAEARKVLLVEAFTPQERTELGLGDRGGRHHDADLLLEISTGTRRPSPIFAAPLG